MIALIAMFGMAVANFIIADPQTAIERTFFQCIAVLIYAINLRIFKGGK